MPSSARAPGGQYVRLDHGQVDRHDRHRGQQQGQFGVAPGPRRPGTRRLARGGGRRRRHVGGCCHLHVLRCLVDPLFVSGCPRQPGRPGSRDRTVAPPGPVSPRGRWVTRPGWATVTRCLDGFGRLRAPAAAVSPAQRCRWRTGERGLGSGGGGVGGGRGWGDGPATGAASRTASGWGSPGRRWSARRADAGRLSAFLAGMPCLTRSWATVGELASWAVAGRVHRGQVQPGDLPGHAAEDRDLAVVGRADVVLRLGVLQPANSPPPRSDQQDQQQQRGAYRVAALGRVRPPRRSGSPPGWPAGAGRSAPRRGRPGWRRRPRWPCPGRGRRRRRRSGVCLDDVLVGRVRDDHRDVVRPAAAQRELHQPLDALLRVGVLAQASSPIVSALTTPERPSLQIR